MKVATNGLPSLYEKAEPEPVTDPLYPGLEIPGESLTDHHRYGGFVDLTGFEIQMNEDLKLHHPFGGKMSFPDDLDCPSRTIMATQFSVSRMSIVIKDSRSRRGLRRPTPRECACLQGYPISYQFWGTSSASKYKLVGNSVPVGVSRDIARSILEDMGKPVPRSLLIRSRSGEPSPKIELPKKKRHVLRDRFRWHPVECMVASCRVDLDNTGEFTPKKDPDAPIHEFNHAYRWDSILHVGVGRPRWKHASVGMDALLEAVMASDISPGRRDRLLADVRSLHGSVPDSTSLLCAHKHPSARSWRYSDSDVIRPRALLEKVDAISKKAVKDMNSVTDCTKQIPICPEKGLPTITLVAAFVTYWLCREINYCTFWMNEHSQSMGGLRGHNTCLGVLSEKFPEDI
jgi:hypothetical protein